MSWRRPRSFETVHSATTGGKSFRGSARSWRGETLLRSGPGSTQEHLNFRNPWCFSLWLSHPPRLTVQQGDQNGREQFPRAGGMASRIEFTLPVDFNGLRLPALLLLTDTFNGPRRRSAVTTAGWPGPAPTRAPAGDHQLHLGARNVVELRVGPQHSHCSAALAATGA